MALHYCLHFSNTCEEGEKKNKHPKHANSVSQSTSPCDVGLYERTPAAPSVPSRLCESLWTGWGTEGRARGPDPGLAPKALTITPVHGLPLALLTVPWNGPQEQCKPPRNRPLTVSQQCSLCVKIVKAGPFLHWSCLSFEPQLWANKAGLKVCMVVS